MSDEAAASIRADVAARGRRVTAAGVFALLGAVLLCFAAMTFIAANWQEMTKALRLILLFGAMWLAYGFAHIFERRGHGLFAQAAILAGTGLFGVNIMLIGQMYHLSGDPPGAVLLWGAGALLAALALPSPPALGLAIILAALWSGMRVIETEAAHLWFLPVWALLALSAWWLKWRWGAHALAIALFLWIVSLGFLLPGEIVAGGAMHPLVAAIGCGLIVLGHFAHDRIEAATRFVHPLLVYAVLVAAAGLLATQLSRMDEVGWVLVSAIIILLFALLVLGVSWKHEARGLAGLAYALFCAELLIVYAVTLGTLLDTALFFLTAGLLVIALAWAAYRFGRRAGAREAS